MPGILFGLRGTPLPIIECGLSVPGQSGHVTGRALVDTGATHCCATPEFIARCGLTVEGVIHNTVIGSDAREVPTYKADVLFVGHRFLSPHIPFTFTVTDALILQERLTGYDMLLGWDVLEGMDLTFGRDQTFTLSF